MKLHKGAIMAVLYFMAQDIFSDQNLQGFMRFTESWEGRRTAAYKDTGGWTIGVGHHMGKTAKLKTISHADIDSLLKLDIMKSITVARSTVKGFDKLPQDVKLIVVDMAFNLGEAGFKKFKKTIAACERGDFVTMAHEMKNSKWYAQVGRRSQHHVSKLITLAQAK